MQQATAHTSNIKQADWVICRGIPQVTGIVRRVARDGSWADVEWPHGTKRMKTNVLEVQSSIQIGEWTVTDVTRAQELYGEEEG